MQIQGSLKNNLVLVPRGRFWLPGLGSSPGDPGQLSFFPLQPKIANHRQDRAKGGDGEPASNAATPAPPPFPTSSVDLAQCLSA